MAEETYKLIKLLEKLNVIYVAYLWDPNYAGGMGREYLVVKGTKVWNVG